MNSYQLYSLGKISWLREWKKLLAILLFVGFFFSQCQASDDNAKNDFAVVGEVVLLIGQVEVVDGLGVRRKLNRGQVVRVKDTIETDVGGHAHLRFVDDAVVSLRPRSRLFIDLYTYDLVNPEKNAIRFNLESGVLRSLSGKATESSHERFRLNTPITAIGVLGTDFVVRAESKKMWAAVYSGAIEIAPFDSHGCHSEGLGSCLNATYLSKGMGGIMFEFNESNGGIRMIPLDSEIVGSLVKENKDSGLMMSNMSPEKVGLSESGVLSEETVVLKSASSNSNRHVKPSGAGRMSVSELSATGYLKKINATPFPFAWGRWHGVAWPGGEMAQSIEKAMLGRNVVVANSGYLLFRDVSELTRVPFSLAGDFNFKLSQGQVHFVKNTLAWVPIWKRTDVSLGEISNGELSINFSTKEFASKIEMSHPIVGVSVMNLQGLLSQDGLIRGSNATASRGSGAVSKGGDYASMLFEHPVEAGVFYGVSDWVVTK
jgi:hypothetical protein